MLLGLIFIIPLLSSSLLILLRRWVKGQLWVSVGSSAATFLVSILLFQQVRNEGIQVLAFADWPPPFGIVAVADQAAAIMVAVSALVSLLIGLFSYGTIDKRRERYGYHPLFQILMLGVYGSFLTGDMFNLFVWFEVMLISSFVLITLGGRRPQLEGGFKYVALNIFSSFLFLSALGLLYGAFGTLNYADLHIRISESNIPWLSTTVSLLFLVVFGIKSAVFPLFFWLPASYHTPASPVSALFAGLLTKVGVFVMIRMFTLVFTHDPGFTHSIILILAGATIIIGGLGPVPQMDFRRILSFHIVSQIGYMVMGLGLYTIWGIAGALIAIAHNMIVKTNLFLVAGYAERLQGTFDLRRLGSLYRKYPVLATIFFISAMALTGIPPLSGFFAKFVLVKAALDIESYGIAIAALVGGFLTLYSMVKIWRMAFATERAEDEPADRVIPKKRKLVLYTPMAVLAAMALLTGFFAGPVTQVFYDAAEQMMDPMQYVEAVNPLPAPLDFEEGTR